MSEKRFTYGETIDYNFFDVFEEKKYLGMVQRDSTKIVDRLNEQQDTIEQLHLAIDDLLSHTSCEEIKKENEQLRKDVENLQEVVAELGATLLVNGFEIEINGENLSELIDNE